MDTVPKLVPFGDFGPSGDFKGGLGPLFLYFRLKNSKELLLLLKCLKFCFNSVFDHFNILANSEKLEFWVPF